MKTFITAATLVAALAAAGVASAQTAPAAPAPAMAPAAASAFSTDTPIETIVANADGKAVLEKDAPGLTTHPMYDQFKSMSLKELAPMSQGKIDDAALVKLNADLATVKPK